MTRAASPARLRWATALAAALVPLTAGCHPATLCGSPPPVRPAVPAPPAGYPFGPASVWRTDVTSGPVAADSAALVRRLTGSIADRYGGIAAFNAGHYGNNFWVAPAGTPRVDVAFDDCQHKGYVPDGLTGPRGQFTGVPIPDGATPATGTDRMMSVYSPSSDQLWEFWVAARSDDGRWSACWGGRIDGVSHSPGYFPRGFGATATGLSDTGGMVSLADVRSGSIQHAMSLVIPDPASGGRYSWPAQRSDGGSHAADAIPEGTRLRLDPSLDLDRLHLTPVAAMIARAAQRYGFIVVDQGPSVAVVAEQGTAELAATGRDPWQPFLGDTPDHQVLKHFPWNRVQVLPQDYGKPTADGCT